MAESQAISPRLTKASIKPTIVDSSPQIILRDIPAGFEQKLTLSLPFLFQLRSDTNEFIALHVIEHNDIRPSINGFIRLLPVRHLDVEEKTKSTNFTSLLYCFRDRPYSCEATHIRRA